MRLRIRRVRFFYALMRVGPSICVAAAAMGRVFGAGSSFRVK